MAETKTLWHKSDDDADWRPVGLHAIDASHALEADPEHWRQDKPEGEPASEPEKPEVVEVVDQPAAEPETKPETEQ